MKHDIEFPNMTINLLECALDILGCRLPKTAIIQLPYCWHDVPGTNHMILLNRLYKPIGVMDGVAFTRYGVAADAWADYADYPELMAPRDLVHSDHAARASHTPADLHRRALFCNPHPDDPRRWFFNDRTDPRQGKKYRDRLAAVIRDNIDALEAQP